jgi:hypothetical protein
MRGGVGNVSNFVAQTRLKSACVGGQLRVGVGVGGREVGEL